mmetsp:Transcript_227/g.227  ORF Transcript_227/g.227 Transcript_227/m.227 type:complete len:160 (+) Transcript_227:246-725(+)
MSAKDQADTFFYYLNANGASEDPIEATDSFLKEDTSLPRQNGADFGMVWIDVEINPSYGCSWYDYSYSSNCEYLKDLVGYLQVYGHSVGIYTTLYMWEQIMGSRYACPDVAYVPLWYAHYDYNPSFSDYSQIGGWTTPAIKQYEGDKIFCGAGTDFNYY